MTLTRAGAKIAGGSVAIMLLASACGGSSSGPPAASSGGKTGGTLTIFQNGDFEHLDPGRIYVTNASDAGRLFLRGLTTYKPAPAPDGSQLVPDLATTLGDPSADLKTWTYHLKPGLKYEDGTAITAQDIKYGVERTYSSVITSGPQYQKSLIVGSDTYKGPYVGDNNGGKGLSGITTPDANTIVFTLNKPFSEWPFVMALGPISAPVPKAKDTKENYDNHPVSDGPYKIDTYVRKQTLTLVRNPNWDKSTDTVRPAYPDKIVFDFTQDPKVADQRLITDGAADQTATLMQDNVQPEDLPQIQSTPNVKSRSTAGSTGCEFYIALNVTRIKDVKVREALNYATDKQAWRTAKGGESAGDYATTMLPPSIAGYGKFDLYPAPVGGDAAKAKQMLTDAGVTNPTFTLGFSNTPSTSKGVQALQQSYKQAGITITLKPIERSTYYTVVGDISKPYDMIYGGWCPDWPSASTILPPLFDGRQIVPQGNVNWSQLNDKSIDDSFDSIGKLTDPAQAATQWGAMDKTIMGLAPVVPLLYDKIVTLSGSKVKGAYIAPAFGGIDVISLSVQ